MVLEVSKSRLASTGRTRMVSNLAKKIYRIYLGYVFRERISRSQELVYYPLPADNF